MPKAIIHPCRACSLLPLYVACGVTQKWWEIWTVDGNDGNTLFRVYECNGKWNGERHYLSVNSFCVVHVCTLHALPVFLPHVHWWWSCVANRFPQQKWSAAWDYFEEVTRIGKRNWMISAMSKNTVLQPDRMSIDCLSTCYYCPIGVLRVVAHPLPRGARQVWIQYQECCSHPRIVCIPSDNKLNKLPIPVQQGGLQSVYSHFRILVIAHAHCSHSHDFSIEQQISACYQLSEFPWGSTVPCCNHMSDCSVQCAIGAENSIYSGTSQEMYANHKWYMLAAMV